MAWARQAQTKRMVWVERCSLLGRQGRLRDSNPGGGPVEGHKSKSRASELSRIPWEAIMSVNKILEKYMKINLCHVLTCGTRCG